MSGPRVRASAPGKLFLVGEYAVLDGAPALLTAVDRRVGVELAPAADRVWRVSAPNLGIDDLALAAGGELPATLSDSLRERLKVFDAVRAVCSARLGPAPAPQAVTIESSAFARAGHKLGLGSSAAVASALTQAFARLRGACLGRDALIALAVEAHRQAQGGAGSGADVAAAVAGGLISYRAGAAPVAVDWPAGLRGLVVATGRGAATQDLVATVKQLARDAPGDYARLMAPLWRLAGDAVAALAEPAAFIRLLRGYAAALIALDQRADAGIVTPRHRELAALAERHGAVFKSCGAGGGDVGLAFGQAGAGADRLAAALAGCGSPALDVAMNAPGVRVEPA